MNPPDQRVEAPEEAVEAVFRFLYDRAPRRWSHSGRIKKSDETLLDDIRERLEQALPALHSAWLRDMEERLLGEGTRKIAGRAAYEDFDPDGDWETLGEPLQMTWEGNTAAGIEAALTTLHPEEPNHEA